MLYNHFILFRHNVPHVFTVTLQVSGLIPDWHIPTDLSLTDTPPTDTSPSLAESNTNYTQYLIHNIRIKNLLIRWEITGRGNIRRGNDQSGTCLVGEMSVKEVSIWEVSARDMSVWVKSVEESLSGISPDFQFTTDNKTSTNCFQTIFFRKREELQCIYYDVVIIYMLIYPAHIPFIKQLHGLRTQDHTHKI